MTKVKNVYSCNMYDDKAQKTWGDVRKYHNLNYENCDKLKNAFHNSWKHC